MRKFELDYFSAYQKAWNAVMAYQIQLANATSIQDSRQYLLLNLREFLMEYLSKLRSQLESCKTPQREAMTRKLFLRQYSALYAVEKEIEKRGIY